MLRNSRLYISILLIFQLIFLPIHDSLSAQSVSDEKTIDQARKSYYEGNFDQAIVLIKNCLKEAQLDSTNLQEAYIILAQAYLAKNFNEASREVVIKLLELNPHYSPTIEQEPPPFVSLVEQVKLEKSPAAASESGNESKWLWIGAGGALVIGAATFIIFNQKNNETIVDNKLKDPPSMPQNP